MKLADATDAATAVNATDADDTIQSMHQSIVTTAQLPRIIR